MKTCIMTIRKTLAAVAFAAASFIVTLAAPSGAQAQTPLTVPLCKGELARLYQQIGRCSDEACRHQVQLAIVRLNARCG
jgi:hypothetical protein